jgi:hypothetical protein
MIIGDFMFFPKDLPKGSETEMFATETLLVHTIPSVVKGLPIAFGFHSDTAINGKVDLSWEIYGAGRRLGDFGGPIEVRLAPNEVQKTAFKLPDFEVPHEGQYTFVLFASNERLMDAELEIRLPRE